MAVESMSGKKDWWFVVGSALGVVLFIGLTVALLMLPKPSASPAVMLTATEIPLPTITPLPTMTPFPTATAFPTYTPFPTAAPAGVSAETTGLGASGVVTYVVQPGDTVSDIADMFDISVAALLVANDLDDETIFPDDVLTIPPQSEDDDEAAEPLVHTVQAGDTLSTIAAEYGVTVEEIKTANDLDTDILQLGDKLIIPNN